MERENYFVGFDELERIVSLKLVVAICIVEGG